MSTYKITTSLDITGVAPGDHLWSAHFGDIDEDTECGYGTTEADAIEDLIANHDVPWGGA